MEVFSTALDGCFAIKPRIFEDSRGYFYESFNEQVFAEAAGARVHFIQDNQSFSSFGVLRGLHFQKGEHAQAKLVRVLKGEVLDVAVDLRVGSKTYGQWHSIVLSEENKLQFFVPRGFAHGFVVLSKQAEFFYKCDNYYDKSSEAGLHYADPNLNINWHIPNDKLIISEKDKVLPVLQKVSYSI
jgi:dTDP-4-dehydrorhamnose 3,5-epimerase